MLRVHGMRLHDPFLWASIQTRVVVALGIVFYDGQAGSGGSAPDYWCGYHPRTGVRLAYVVPGSNQGTGNLIEGTDNPKTPKVSKAFRD